MNSQTDTDLLEECINQLRPLGQKVCAALEEEYGKLGYVDQQVLGVDFDSLRFELKRDPFSQQFSMVGVWLNQKQQRLGSLVFHADSTFFAEYDVVKPHPAKSRWFVEAVTAWGHGHEVKSEARLMPAV